MRPEWRAGSLGSSGPVGAPHPREHGGRLQTRGRVAPREGQESANCSPQTACAALRGAFGCLCAAAEGPSGPVQEVTCPRKERTDPCVAAVEPTGGYRECG